MIFKPQMIEAILDGRKTITRRPVVSLWGDDAQPLPYREGRTYAVQPGRGQRSVARILILDAELQPLSDALAPDEARREGFAHGGEFIEYWQALYGPDVDLDLAVWRIEFRLVARGAA